MPEICDDILLLPVGNYLFSLILGDSRISLKLILIDSWMSQKLILIDSWQFSLILVDSQWFLNKFETDSHWFLVILNDSCQFYNLWWFTWGYMLICINLHNLHMQIIMIMVWKRRFSALKWYLVCENRLRIGAVGAKTKNKENIHSKNIFCCVITSWHHFVKWRRAYGCRADSCCSFYNPFNFSLF